MTKLFSFKFGFIILILSQSMVSIAQSNQQFGDGFKAGYKTGYCSGDLGCIAPPAPFSPMPGLGSSRTYMDGYNIGFSQGQSDKRKKQTSNNVNTSTERNSLTPTPEQIQQSRLTELQIEEQRLRTLELRRQQNEAYELKAVKNPELEMNNSQEVRLKVSTDIKKYKLNLYIPSTFSEINTQDNTSGKNIKSYIRNYSNGTSLFMGIYQLPLNYKDSINVFYEIAKNVTDITFGFSPTDSKDKLEVKSVKNYGSFYDMGLKSGDVIMVVDTIQVNNMEAFIKATKDYEANDSISLMVLRDGELFQANGTCLKRYGKHFSEFTISGYPSKMVSYMNEVENYGDIIYYLVIQNWIYTNDGVIQMAFSLKNENATPEITEEFWKSYKKLLQQIINSTTIE